MRPTIRRTALRGGALALVLAVLSLLSSGPALAKPPYGAITGSGSTWAYGVIGPWISYAQSNFGMQIAFKPNGSSQGRNDFAQNGVGVVDFADSDIPYQGVDPTTGKQDTSSRPYAYLPVVAGGTAFTYHLTVAGHLVNNLRLSGETIAKIFTNKITNWADPQITRDNGGHALPAEPIRPVVRSDGSGSTAQFTLWMASQYPQIWGPYNGGKNQLTSIYPRQGNQSAVAQDAGVMSTVSSSSGEGDIGYTAYSYPEQAKYPVVYVENPAGYFVQPTAYNVAVALTKAHITGCNASGSCSPAGIKSTDYLTQNLGDVYTYKDPRSYPISSYSYMIIPTSNSDHNMTPSKRQTLGDFLSYDLCGGQSLAIPYGYSPLPANLVKAAFGQVLRLGPKADGGAVSGVDITDQSSSPNCANPTFVKGHPGENGLANIAPMPLPCQKVTSVPCGDGVVPPGTTATNPSGGKVPGGTTTGTTGGTTTAGPGGSTGTNPAAGGGPSGGTAGGPSGGNGSTNPNAPGGSTVPGVDSPANAVPGVDGVGGGTTSASASGVVPTATSLPAQRAADTKVWGWTSVLLALGVVMLPGLYTAWLRRRKGI